MLTVLLSFYFRVVELLLDLGKPPKTARHTAPTEACYTRDSEWILHDSCNSPSPVLDEAGNLPNKPIRFLPRNHLVLVTWTFYISVLPRLCSIKGGSALSSCTSFLLVLRIVSLIKNFPSGWIYNQQLKAAKSPNIILQPYHCWTVPMTKFSSVWDTGKFPHPPFP